MFTIDTAPFPKREEKILRFWEKKKVFAKSLDEEKPYFSFYDGPPFATGLPHYGHLLAGTIKDVVPRYKTMQGYFVPRRFGWDCHGLPVENEIEKEKELYGAHAIEAYGIDRFNEACRSIVLRYTKEWEKTVTRMGRWVDFSKPYKTMDLSFMESLWWVFGTLYEKGLVYEGYKVMPFSAQLGTPLSNFEANLNYKEVDDPSLFVKFKLKGSDNTYFLAWTTTPWTLTSNLALTVHPDEEYVELHYKEHNYIVAKALLSKLFKEEVDIVRTYLGKELEGLSYEPLFPYFANAPNAFKVITDTFVTLEDGTGIVHTAPAFGEVDFYAAKRFGIEPICPIDQNGKFTKEVPDYENLFVKEADKAIIRRLKEENKVFAHSQVRHRYPFCWRSDTPLIYKVVSTWFIQVESIKEDLIEANKKIHWMPGHIQKGRFGKWLDNARDWAVSRNRYWGTPIPIWRSDDGEIRVIKSLLELEEKCGKKIDDLHRHHIDNLTFEEGGKLFRRVEEVFDCWFESGSMPYAQNHYPFENVDFTEETFPADFIAEGLDQTRGWFYTLNVLSVALFNKPAFRNVIVNGIILAEDGEKMSKRLKNYPEPTAIIDKYGADAIRLYMLHSPAVKGEDLKFSKTGVELTLRQVLIPLWNSFSFLSTYATIYKYAPTKTAPHPKADIDRWILSKLQHLIIHVEEAMDHYDLSHAVDPFVGFIDELTNWYIRRSRTRFWADEDTLDRQEAFATLYYVLFVLTKVIAPFIPFIAEEIYQELKVEGDPESVHLASFPKADISLIDSSLEEAMQAVQRAVTLGHALRKEKKLKVRQPLPAVHLVAADKTLLKALEKHTALIQEELNVKKAHFHTDESLFLTKLVKPNFSILGRKLGKKLPLVQKALLTLSADQIHSLETTQKITLPVNGEEMELSLQELQIHRQVQEGIAAGHDREIALALDTELSKELIEEGIAREIVNKVNTMRRDKNLEVSDRIHLYLETTEEIKAVFEKYEEYISHEVLATKTFFEEITQGEIWDINGHTTKIHLSKTTLF